PRSGEGRALSGKALGLKAYGERLIRNVRESSLRARIANFPGKCNLIPTRIPMPLQITISFRGVETVKVFTSQKVAIGRASDADKPDLDLSEDACVSRQHASLELKNGVSWLTDLGSKFGTQVNGREISGHGEWRLSPEDTAIVGETSLRVRVVPAGKPAP